MTNDNKEKFYIENIQNELPVNYGVISIEKINDHTSTRSAQFSNYGSGLSECFGFYKPISRLTKHDEKNI